MKDKWLKRIFIFGVLLYSFTFTNQFVWDDYLYIVNNIYLGSWEHLTVLLTSGVTHGAGSVDNYYRPLASLSLSLDKAIWHDNVFGYHLTQTWMHALSGTLLYLLLKELHFGRWASLWVAFIFLSHPVQVQAVAYMASRGDPQYALFLFTGLYLWQKSWSKKPQIKSFKPSPQLLIGLSLLCYIASFLSKEIGIAGIGLYVLVWWIKNEWPSLKKIKTKIKKDKSHSIALILLGTALTTYLYLRFTIFNFTNWEVGGVLPEIYKQNLMVRIYTFGGVFWRYLTMILKPFPMYFERSSPILSSLNGWFIGFIATISLVAWLGYKEYLKMKTGWIWTGLAWFLGMLVPVSGIITVNGLLFENWLYLPIIGFLIIIISLIRQYISKKSLTNYTYLFYMIIGGLAFLTIQQTQVWANEITFFEHNLTYNPTARIHRNLGTAYAKDSQYQKALDHFDIALQKSVENPEEVMLSQAIVHDNLQNTKSSVEKLLEAIETNNEYYQARLYLIKVLYETKEYQQALPQAQELVNQRPNDGLSHVRLGQIHLALGNKEIALEQFAKAIEVSNNDPRIIDIIEQIKK